MEELIKVAQAYGATGLTFLSLGWFIVYIMRGHRDERKELMGSLVTQHNECMAARKEATEALNNNTDVLSELRTMIRDK